MILKKAIFRSFIVTVCLLSFINTNAQDTIPEKGSVYSINNKVEIPMTAALFLSNFIGFKYLDKVEGLTEDEIYALDVNDIPRIDRIATEQDAEKRGQFNDASDWIMNATIALPAMLVIDKKIRRDWFELGVIYFETHAINSSLYLGVSAFTNRIRPFVYNPDVAMEDKMANGTQESFFSGHASTTAAASFFMAKVYSDYHPELGNKKFWVFGAALIPPVVVGALRVKAMKHFPTDIMAGITVGAAMGILVPHIHKKKKNKDLVFIPYTGAVTGMSIQYTLR